MRYKVIKNEKVQKLIEKKQVLVDEVKELQEKIEKMERERDKVALRISRINDRALPLIEKHKEEMELDEFEEHNRLYLDEKTKELRLEIINRVEEFKETYKKQKQDAINKLNKSQGNTG